MSPAAALPQGAGAVLGGLLVALLALPILALATSVSPSDMVLGTSSPLFAPALWLSLKTTSFSIASTCVLGTPLALWLARGRSRFCRSVELVVQLPIVIPPAVVGVALLQTFGRQGLLGPILGAMNVSLPFTEAAVVLSQLVVASPFYVQAAANAFRKVDDDLVLVARTLGASPSGAFFRVTIPIALPGLVAGASLAWARALGEFGATLLFAGNSPTTTQTMPLAIFAALESDVRLAVVLSLVLTLCGALVLLALRLAQWVWSRFLDLTSPPTSAGLAR